MSNSNFLVISRKKFLHGCPPPYCVVALKIFSTNLPDLDRRITDERFKRQLLKEIKGLAVRTSHLPKNSYFNIHGLTAEGPANIFFETKDGRKSVLQHFQDRYHFRVQFPNLPCVVERKVTK